MEEELKSQLHRKSSCSSFRQVLDILTLPEAWPIRSVSLEGLVGLHGLTSPRLQMPLPTGPKPGGGRMLLIP